MSESEHGPRNRPDDKRDPRAVEIFVNTRPVDYAEDTISYTQAVDIAFPNIPKGPDVTFSVTFTGAKGDTPSGSLVDGGASARVRKGMSVDVVHSNRS